MVEVKGKIVAMGTNLDHEGEKFSGVILEIPDLDQLRALAQYFGDSVTLRVVAFADEPKQLELA